MSTFSGSLTGQQARQIREALQDAFDRSDLRQFVYEYLDCQLDEVAGNGPDSKTVFELVQWAMRETMVSELIQAASSARPKNPKLVMLVRDATAWGLVTGKGEPAAPSAAPSPQRQSGVTKGRDPQLAVNATLKMYSVPAAIVHLLDPEEYPLVRVEVENSAGEARRLRVITVVEGYSAPAKTTLDLGSAAEESNRAVITQRPNLFREKVRRLGEPTRAALLVTVEEADTGYALIEKSLPLWLAARNMIPLRIRDEESGRWQDTLPYLGAFVTENEPSVQSYLKTVAAHHPRKRLRGYFAADPADSVRSQVRALTAALKSESKLFYAPIRVQTMAADVYQRVRLPRQCLAVGLASALEGVLLYCSLLEAMGLQAAIVWGREHVIVGWKESPVAQEWTYLDTTKLEYTFEQAMEWGDAFVEHSLGASTDEFRILPIRDLREQGIVPVE